MLVLRHGAFSENRGSRQARVAKTQGNTDLQATKDVTRTEAVCGPAWWEFGA